MSTKTILILVLGNFRPRFRFNFTEIILAVKYSLSITANSLLTYGQRNLDNMIIGKMANSSVLGAYNLAYQIMLMPISLITNVIKEVLFPVVSKSGNDRDSLRLAYYQLAQIIAIIVFPVLFLLVIIPDILILRLLGDKWVAVINILPPLAFIAIPQSIAGVNGTVFLSSNRADIPLWLNLVSLPFYLVAFILGMRSFGIMGLIYGYIVINSIFLAISYRYVLRLLNSSLITYVKALLPIVLLSACTGMFGYLVRYEFGLVNIGESLLVYVIPLFLYSFVCWLLRKNILIVFAN